MKLIHYSIAIIIACGVGPAYADTKIATFAGGCFWCMEPPYDELEGVLSTVSGYTGGELKNPGYKQVSRGDTGHYEAIQVHYDPDKVSYQTLLDVFWRNVDPFDAGGQFCDRGTQYLTAVFFHDTQQEKLARLSKKSIQAKLGNEQEIITPILPVKKFYPAEDYHQDYYTKNPIRYKFYRHGCGRDKRLDEVMELIQQPD